MNSESMCRLCVISFDFRQPGKAGQTRKTRFFRRLYGYKQRVKRRLKNGRVADYSYYYPGILDQVEHVKLGKSVFGVLPGSEKPVVELLQSFPEIKFYQFISWLPIPTWPSVENKLFHAPKLISQIGHLSILVIVYQHGGRLKRSSLYDMGFDRDFVDSAVTFLQKCGLLVEEFENVVCTSQGDSLGNTLLVAIGKED